MTEFEKWCKLNDYDPNGEFELVEVDGIDIHRGSKIGDRLRLWKDDKSECQFFKKDDTEYQSFRLSQLRGVKATPQPSTTQFDPHTFDFRQVLPKCWVRNYVSNDWEIAYFVRNGTGNIVVVLEDGSCCARNHYTFEDPATEQRKTELKARADELRAELARIEKELGE